MKLMKTFLIALLGLVLTNCGNQDEAQIQKLDANTPSLEQAKADFEAIHAEHLRFVLKRTNQLRRGELTANEALLQEFENQWKLQLESLEELAHYSKEEDLKEYLKTVFEQSSNQGIVATPCYDNYLKELNKANESLILCAVVGIVTGGEALPACAVYYFNELRTAYNAYSACMSETYKDQQGKE
jgi:hypothetical protein